VAMVREEIEAADWNAQLDRQMGYEPAARQRVSMDAFMGMAG
jgi:hypothetical protein